MKRVLSLTLILLLLVTALVGCGGSENTDAASEQEQANTESSEPEATTEEETEEPAEEVVEEFEIPADGVYEGVAEGMHEIKVSVEVAGGKIAKVELVEQEETEGIADDALEQVPAAIVENNTPYVEVVSGATLSSEGIMEAVKNALSSEGAAEVAAEEEVAYADGVYEGVAEGMHEIKVSVEVVEGKIAKVELVEQEETEGIADDALAQVPNAIVEKNSPNVEAVSGATLTSEGIMEAVKNALEAAK